nr:MAG TPA: helix-turn-helix domain protein [Caudoviricetes sp.]
MTQGERVKAVRKSLGLTLEIFGAKIGLKKSGLSLIENGRNELTDSNAKAICREFGVNEDWLRTGVGDMFIPEDVRYLNSVSKLGNEQNSFKKFCINMLMELPDKYWDYIYREFKRFEIENSSSDAPDTPEELEAMCPPQQNSKENAG